jgi:hypothetical protein
LWVASSISVEDFPKTTRFQEASGMKLAEHLAASSRKKVTQAGHPQKSMPNSSSPSLVIGGCCRVCDRDIHRTQCAEAVAKGTGEKPRGHRSARWDSDAPNDGISSCTTRSPRPDYANT